MNSVTRRRFMQTGAAAVVGVAGLAVADSVAKRYGLIAPDCGGVYGPGETLTYAAARVLGAHSKAREFSRSMISKTPFMNEIEPKLTDGFRQMEANKFVDWRLTVDGMVQRPGTFSLADLHLMPRSSQITEIECEEGWSYIAEWIGTPLSQVLTEAGVLPQARYVVYTCPQKGWWDSLDLRDAMHPQTLLTMGMNDGDLPVGFGGPLRLRVPRELGYKSMKFLNRVTLTDSLKHFGKGLGSASPEGGYSWYAGI